MKRIRALLVVGTRPEAIKQAPVLWAMRNRPERFIAEVLSTGQHREMLQQMSELLELSPEHHCDLMQPGQTLTALTARTMNAVDDILEAARPDVVLVQGDTTTAMAAGLAAFYRRIPVGHVEAGLRSGSVDEPFPEEVNRLIVDRFARFMFAPTQGAAKLLAAEGLPAERVFVTGNTVVDALLSVSKRLGDSELMIPDLPDEALNSRVVLVTCHRRESFGAPIRGILSAIARLAHKNPKVHFVYPVHLNPNVKRPAFELLGNLPNVHLLPPLDYEEFVSLLSRVYLVLSDSGGVQEEAPSLGVPVLVLRNLTERPEGVSAGCNKLVGTDPNLIFSEASKILEDPTAHAAMAKAKNPYGDGKAGQRIADILDKEFPRD